MRWKFIALFLFSLNFLQAQEYHQTNKFSMEDGLPSNHIYDIVQDHDGFLWLATENGVSKFDGKNFHNYSVRQGLPANQVLGLLVDKQGTIWVNCMKQVPAYFETKTNEFIQVTHGNNIDKLSTGLWQLYTTPSGHTRYQNGIGHIEFENKSIKHICNNLDHNTQLRDDHSKKYFEIKSNIVNNKEEWHITSEGSVIKKIAFGAKGVSRSCFIHDNKFYVLYSHGQVYRFSLNSQKTDFVVQDSITFEEELGWVKFSENAFSVYSTSGTVYNFDESLHLLHSIKTDEHVVSVYLDKEKYVWVGTSDKGLIRYRNNGIVRLQPAMGLISQNFISITPRDKDIYAANYEGQVVKLSEKKMILMNLPIPNEIIKLLNTEQGLHVFALNKWLLPSGKVESLFLADGRNLGVKCCMQLNETTVFLGTVSGLYRLDLITRRLIRLKSPPGRVNCIVKKNEDNLYFIGPEGLYNYNIPKNEYLLIPLEKNLKSDKFNLMMKSEDGVLWISTIKGLLHGVRDNKIVYSLTNYDIMPENISCMASYKSCIYLGTRTGIKLIEYSTNPAFKYNIYSITKYDGLPSNTVNDLCITNNVLYATTEAGLCYLPINKNFDDRNLKIRILQVLVNRQKVPLQDTISLNQDQVNFSIFLSGLDLNGHFKKFQYAMSPNGPFEDFEGNVLNIGLPKGMTILYFRGLDVNNHFSEIKLLTIDIYKPVYFYIWFQVASISLLGFFFIFPFYKRKLRMQKLAYEHQQELDTQRITIAADLHDDIGASLSSLQLNSAVARHMLNKDISGAVDLLKKIEDQSKVLAEKMNDTIWSMKPQTDEFMSISSRIKTFVYDILGPSDIHYEIILDPDIDNKITAITLKKNIVLIVKEAVNNLAKYSGAANATIKIHIENHVINISVKDDGCGINQSDKKGNGLENMRKRAQELGGSIVIESAPKIGTHILAAIPCP